MNLVKIVLLGKTTYPTNLPLHCGKKLKLTTSTNANFDALRFGEVVLSEKGGLGRRRGRQR